MKKLGYIVILFICIISLEKVYAADYKSYNIGDPVYYNPQTGKECKASESSSTDGVNYGCMRFYVIKNSSTSDSTVRAILDHNTSNNVKWNETEKKSDGPVKAVATLNQDTNDWNYVSDVGMISENEITSQIMGVSNFDHIGYETTNKTDGSKYQLNMPNKFFFYKDGYTLWKRGIQEETHNTSQFPDRVSYQNSNDDTQTKKYDFLKGKYWTSTPCEMPQIEEVTTPAGSNSSTVHPTPIEYAYLATTAYDVPFLDAQSVGGTAGVRPVVTISKQYLTGVTEQTTTNDQTTVVDNTDNTELINDKTDISVTVPTGETKVDSTTKVSIEKVGETTETYKTIESELKKLLKDILSKVSVYDINLLKDNVKIQPSGKVLITFPVPSGFDINRIAVYRLEDNGSLTKLDHKIVDNKIQVETDHFSNYSIVELKKQETKTSNNIKNPKTGIKKYYEYGILIGLIAVTAYIIIKKKKVII